MPERNLTYRVLIDAGSARSSAQLVRRTIEAELRQIKLGQLDTTSISSAISEAQRLRLEFEHAAQAADDIRVPTVRSGGSRGAAGGGNDWAQALLGQVPGGVGALGSAFVGGFAATATVGAIREIGQSIDELGRRGAIFQQLDDVLADYARSVGTNADAIIAAGKKASQGTIAEFDLILNANRAIQYEVAKTPEAYAKLIELSTALGRAQGISDTQALQYITTGIARESRLILDNLGLIIDIDKATSDYAATLGKSAKDLTTAERKQALLDEAFRQGTVAIEANRDASGSAATQYERLDANIQDLKDSFGEWLATASAGKIGALADAILLVNQALNGERRGVGGISKDVEGLVELRDKLQNGESVSVFGVATVAGEDADMIDFLNKKIDESTEKLDKLKLAAGAAYTFEIPNADEITKRQRQAESEAQAARETDLLSQQTKIDDSLGKDASSIVDVVGLNQAIEILKQQKAFVDQSIQELINSSITDPDEIALRLEQIKTDATSIFDDLKESAGNVEINFGGFDTALDMFNQPFVDMLPGMADLRDQLIDLQNELALTDSMTADQAAEFDYLSAAAAAAGGDAAMLADVTNELGTQFLAANDHAAALLDQMYMAAAAYSAGQISAAQYAGITASLGGQLLTLAGQAGVATGAISQLIAVQSGLSNQPGFLMGFGRGNAIGQGVQTKQDAINRDEARKAAIRAQKDAETAAKRAAREAESAAKRAGKELEAGAKKAAQELQSALKSVPGLFSRSQVTQGQLDQAKGGVDQNFADDYLRRLQDEVENGKDWADVSIDEARSALQDLGVQVSGDNKIAFQQFADAWESGLLFFDADNVAKFINAEAVQAALDLQEKARIGQENIMKAFGVAIDDAVDAAVTGASGVGSSTGSFAAADYTIPVTAELVPIPDSEFEPGGAFAPVVKAVVQPQVQGPLPQSAFMPTLGGVSPVIDVAAIQGELNTLTITPTFDTSAIDFATAKTEIEAGLSVTAKVVATGFEVQAFLDANLIKETLTPHITATIDGAGFTVAGLTEIDQAGATVSERLKTAIAGNVSTTTWDDEGIVAPIATGLITAINTQVRGTSFEPVGASVAEYLKSAIAGNVSTTQWSDGEIVAPIATGLITAINTQVRGTQDGFKREGQNVASIIMGGISSSWGEVNAEGAATNSLAMGLLSELNNQLSANQGFFFAAGQVPAGNLIDGYKNSFGGGSEQAAALVTPLLSAIGTGIRANIEGFRQRGGTVAREMISGFSTQFSSEEFKTTLIAAGETMASYLTIGILSGINGGQLVEAIGAQVLADITATVEAPVQ